LQTVNELLYDIITSKTCKEFEDIYYEKYGKIGIPSSYFLTVLSCSSKDANNPRPADNIVQCISFIFEIEFKQQMIRELSNEIASNIDAEIMKYLTGTN